MHDCRSSLSTNVTDTTEIIENYDRFFGPFTFCCQPQNFIHHRRNRLDRLWANHLNFYDAVISYRHFVWFHDPPIVKEGHETVQRCYYKNMSRRESSTVSTQSEYTEPPNKRRSSKRQLEEQLEETIERHELLAKATNDVIYDLDIKHATVTWNEALFTHYGYDHSPEVSTLEWWAAHIHPDDAFRVQEEIGELLNSQQQTWYSEYRFLKADGSYASVRDRAFVLRDKKGALLRIIGSFLDITGQKNLDRAKDEFMSLVSHQLRTPLTIIRMYSEILGSGMAGDLTSQQQKYVDQIAEGGSRMIKLVGDILNISRLELERIKISPSPCDVNALIQTHIEELTPIANERHIRIRFTPDRTLPKLNVDPVIFGQIMYNLLSNAIRYSRNGQGEVTVSFVKTSEGYTLNVTDNGIGIPLRAQPHIFKRFFRANNALKFEGGGTGLGLYMVQLIVETFKGKVWFESRIGTGSTFHVLFPPSGMQSKQSDSNGNLFVGSPVKRSAP